MVRVSGQEMDLSLLSLKAGGKMWHRPRGLRSVANLMPSQEGITTGCDQTDRKTKPEANDIQSICKERD